MTDDIGALYPGVGTDSDTRAQQENRRRIEDTRAARERGVGEGADPAYVTSMEFFDSMSHEEMYAKVLTIRPAEIAQLAASWGTETNAVGMAFARLNVALGGTIGSGWRGVAADGAAAGVQSFVSSAGNVGEVMNAVHMRLRAVEFGSAEVLARMPPPVPPAPGVDLFVPGAGKAAEAACEEARLEAVRVMNGAYVPTYQPAGDGVPAFTAAHDPTNPVGPGSGSGSGQGTGAGGGGGGGVGGRGLPDDTRFDGGSGDATRTQAAAAEAAPSGAGGDASRQGFQGGNGAGGGQGAGAAGAGSSGVGTPTTGVGGTGSGAGGSGRSGSAGVRGGEGGVRGAAPGGIGAGGRGAGGGLGAGTVGVAPGVGSAGEGSATRGAAGGRGGAPMGGMGAGGARAAGEDDEEHRTPGYLINVDNGNELIGDLPMVAPPVLGA